MIRLLAILTLCLTALSARAQEEIVLGLSQDEVAISATFTGSEILIFGAIRRESPPPEFSDLGVIIAVAGPNVPTTVRKKERIAGIWVNTRSVEIEIAPSFYAVATSGPMDDVLNPLEDLQQAITGERVIRAVGQDAFSTNDFTDAYARLKEREDLFQVLEGAVSVDEDTLFHTSIALPSKLVEGNYRTRIFITRNGQVVDQIRVIIPVFKVGIERWLYNLATEQGAIYGLLSLFIAAISGWAASAIFGRLRR